MKDENFYMILLRESSWLRFLVERFKVISGFFLVRDEDVRLNFVREICEREN
jgi:hypothetical protein